MLKNGMCTERLTNKKVRIHKKPTTYIIKITETSKNSILFLMLLK